MLKRKNINSMTKLLVYVRLNVTFGNDDDNCIAGGEEVFNERLLFSIRLYGLILQSV
jgi:hypothetical protein